MVPLPAKSGSFPYPRRALPDFMERSHRSAVLTALLVTLLWSSSWILIRWGLDDEGLRPITFAGLRYLLASVVLIGLVLSSRSLRSQVGSLRRSQWAHLVLLGLVFVAVAQGAQFVAIDSQPAATSSLVLSLTPLFVAGASSMALAEHPDRRQLFGVGLIVLGAALYFLGDLGFTPIGMTAALVGLAANVVAALLGRAANRERDLSPIVVTVVSMSVGASILAALGIGIEGTPSVSTNAWLILGWLAVVNTALAFTLWNRSLQHLTATESAAINNTMLIQIAVLAWLFLGEVPGGLDIVGMVGVSVGVYLAQQTRAEMKASR
jgi:drug/metabolite transporter (DMT)-like permease